MGGGRRQGLGALPAGRSGGRDAVGFSVFIGRKSSGASEGREPPSSSFPRSLLTWLFGRGWREGSPKLTGNPPAEVLETTLADDRAKTKELLKLTGQCRQALEQGVRSVVIDLTRVRIADTKLVATILLLRRLAVSRGVNLRVRTSESVRQWMEVCGVERWVALCDGATRPRQGSAASTSHTSTR